MFGAYVRENRKVVIALAVYTAVFAFIFWLYRLPLGAVGYAALVCLFLLLVWLAVDYRRFAVRLRLLRRLEQEITLSTEQLPEPDGALEAQYQALVRALDADRRAQLTRSQQGYQELVEYYTVWAHQIKTPIARQLGIAELLQKFPYELSGGQKQRVAVARALITQPKLVLADEPTGALDSRATDELLRLFEDVNRGGQTILMVTHSVKAASHASRVLFIKDGEVFHEIYRGESTDEQLYQKISDTLTMLATGGEHHA